MQEEIPNTEPYPENAKILIPRESGDSDQATLTRRAKSQKPKGPATAGPFLVYRRAQRQSRMSTKCPAIAAAAAIAGETRCVRPL